MTDANLPLPVQVTHVFGVPSHNKRAYSSIVSFNTCVLLGRTILTLYMLRSQGLCILTTPSYT